MTLTDLEGTATVVGHMESETVDVPRSTSTHVDTVSRKGKGGLYELQHPVCEPWLVYFLQYVWRFRWHKMTPPKQVESSLVDVRRLDRDWALRTTKS